MLLHLLILGASAFPVDQRLDRRQLGSILGGILNPNNGQNGGVLKNIGQTILGGISNPTTNNPIVQSQSNSPSTPGQPTTPSQNGSNAVATPPAGGGLLGTLGNIFGKIINPNSQQSLNTGDAPANPGGVPLRIVALAQEAAKSGRVIQ